jgi:hypothetical protein
MWFFEIFPLPEFNFNLKKDNFPKCSTLGVQEGSQNIEGHLKLYPFLL